MRKSTGGYLRLLFETWMVYFLIWNYIQVGVFYYKLATQPKYFIILYPPKDQ